MKKPLLILGLITTLIWNGCVPTVHPLLTEKDALFDPALLGTWAEGEDKDNSWTFTRASAEPEDKDYRLVLKENGKTAQFGARLGSLSGKRFLMLSLLEDDEAFNRQNDWAKASLVRGHLFLRVYEVGKELKLSLPNLDRFLEKTPAALSHFKQPGGGLVLTGSTQELQSFFGRHADNPEIFEPSDSRFKRVPVGAQKKP
jgi:hypothetical protein